MDTFDAQLTVCALLASQAPILPDRWRHHRPSGSLTFAYQGRSNEFTWDREAVADMVRRPVDHGLAPRGVRDLIARCREVERLVGERDDVRPPDEYRMDLAHDEIDVLWVDEKVAIVIEPGTDEGHALDRVARASQR